MCFDGTKPSADALMRAIGEAKGRAEREAGGARCPACGSPGISADRSYSGWWACRNCGLEWSLPEPAPGTPPAEDRGTPVWIWRDGDGDATFERPKRGETAIYEVSTPIGWGLKANPRWGVVLANVYGLSLAAGEVLYYAERGQRGFRVRGKAGEDA